MSDLLTAAKLMIEAMKQDNRPVCEIPHSATALQFLILAVKEEEKES